MNLDTQRVRDLLDKRDQIDQELTELFSQTNKERKPITCSKCGESGHTARTCTKPEA